MTLHATSYYLSLVTLSPPRSHKVWSMEDITQCESQGDLFLFNISGKETGKHFDELCSREDKKICINE